MDAAAPAAPEWRTNDHDEHRERMRQQIVSLLRQRKPEATEEWQAKLPVMATRLEDSLYKGANSFADYNNLETLKSRLQDLAKHLNDMRNHKNPGSGDDASSATSSASSSAGGRRMVTMQEINPSMSADCSRDRMGKSGGDSREFV